MRSQLAVTRVFKMVSPSRSPPGSGNSTNLAMILEITPKDR